MNKALLELSRRITRINKELSFFFLDVINPQNMETEWNRAKKNQSVPNWTHIKTVDTKDFDFFKKEIQHAENDLQSIQFQSHNYYEEHFQNQAIQLHKRIKGLYSLIKFYLESDNHPSIEERIDLSNTIFKFKDIDYKFYYKNALKDYDDVFNKYSEYPLLEKNLSGYEILNQYQSFLKIELYENKQLWDNINKDLSANTGEFIDSTRIFKIINQWKVKIIPEVEPARARITYKKKRIEISPNRRFSHNDFLISMAHECIHLIIYTIFQVYNDIIPSIFNKGPLFIEEGLTTWGSSKLDQIYSISSPLEKFVKGNLTIGNDSERMRRCILFIVDYLRYVEKWDFWEIYNHIIKEFKVPPPIVKNLLIRIDRIAFKDSQYYIGNFFISDLFNKVGINPVEFLTKCITNGMLYDTILFKNEALKS